MGMVGSTVGIVDQSKQCGSIVVGFAMDCWCVDCSSRGCGINVGVAAGRRSWMGDAWGLVKTVGAILADVIVVGRYPAWCHWCGCQLVL
jgi:hypothetical protein